MRQIHGAAANTTLGNPITTNPWERGLDTIFRCPRECSRCCRWPKFLGTGVSESTFKCVLKRKDKVPEQRRCSMPEPRTKAKQQFKTECRFTDLELADFRRQSRTTSDILPECGRLAKCCCENKDYRKRELCLPTPPDPKQAEAVHMDQHWVVLPDTRQGFASCVQWEWDPAIPLGEEVMPNSQSLNTRPGYRCMRCKMEFACGGEEIVDCARIQQRDLNQANRLWHASFVRKQDHPLFDRIPRWTTVRGEILYKSIAIGQCASEIGTGLILNEHGKCPHSHFAEEGFCLCRELC